jgi:hypothetical protein
MPSKSLGISTKILPLYVAHTLPHIQHGDKRHIVRRTHVYLRTFINEVGSTIDAQTLNQRRYNQNRYQSRVITVVKLSECTRA